MGSVVSKVASGFGGVLGNAFAAPIKTIFGGSCESVCSGPWDAICFIEHLCVSNLLKLLMILVLCYITLMFFYLLFKVGICQCIAKILCKMCWAACETYWFALEDITCFLWHKLKNTKRVNRRRFRDMEEGYTSSSDGDFSDGYGRHISVGRKRKSSIWKRRKDFRRNSVYPSSRYASCHHHRRHHVRLKTREISVHVKGGSRRRRKSERPRFVRTRHHRRDLRILKRRRLR